MQQTFYSVHDAAKRVGLSWAYLTRLCADNKVPSIRVASRRGEPRYRTRVSQRNGKVRYRVRQGFYVIEPSVVDLLVAFRASGGHLHRGEFSAYLEKVGDRRVTDVAV